MKKFSSIILALILVLIPCLVMYGCGNKSDPTLDSISLTSEIRTVYYLNENIDFKDAKLSFVNSNNETQKIDLTAEMIEGFSTETSGAKTLKINYEDKTISVDYLVIDFQLGKYNLTKEEVFTAYTTNKLSTTNYTTEIYQYLQFNLNGTCSHMERKSQIDKNTNETVYAAEFSLKQTYTWEIRNGKIVLFTSTNETYIVLEKTNSLLSGGIINGTKNTVYTFTHSN